MAAGDGKLKHLRRDPRVTIVVNEDEFPYRGFELRGEARLLDVPYGPVIRRIATRYVGEEASAFYDDDARRDDRPHRTRRGARLGLPRRPDRDGRVLGWPTFADDRHRLPRRHVRAQPGVRDRHRRARPRLALAGPDRRPAGRSGSRRPSDGSTTFRAMTDLAADDAIDRDLLIGELEADAVRRDRRCASTPGTRSTGSTSSGEGLFTLQAREFAPLADRLASTAGRLETLPAVFEAARDDAGRATPGDPWPRFHTETALRQIAGIEELIADALAAADEAAPTDPTVAALRPRLAAAAETARAAVAAFEVHLREVVLPASEGEGRLGEALFAEKMRHTMRSDTLTADRLFAAAEREYVAVRAEMIRLAAELWPVWRPDEPASERRPRARPRRPRRDRRRTPEGGRPARLLPSGERPDRGVLPGARPHRARRRAARHPAGRRSSCARSVARCCPRRVRSTRARRRSSRSPRCPTTGPRSSASRTFARTTTGCSAS